MSVWMAKRAILLQALLRTIKEWPTSIYDTSAVIVAVQDNLDRISSTEVQGSLLMECLAELYVLLTATRIIN
jgi:vacuolar protein sorting-associated protein 41